MNSHTPHSFLPCTKTVTHLFMSCTYTSLKWKQCLCTSCTHIKANSSPNTRPQLQNEINLEMVIPCSIVTTKFIPTSHICICLSLLRLSSAEKWRIGHLFTEGPQANFCCHMIYDCTPQQNNSICYIGLCSCDKTKQQGAWCLSSRAGIDVCPVSFQLCWFSLRIKTNCCLSYVWTAL